MAYEGHCGTCVNFEETNGQPYDKRNADYIKGYCIWYRSCYYPTDSCSSHYEARKTSSTDCYITTIVCNRLGYDDTCDSLEVLRNFRNEVLQKDEKYKEILYEYDTVGPEIASNLVGENLSIIQKIYQSFICPIVSFIKENQYETAIQKYIQMTQNLQNYYACSSSKKVPNEYDYQNGGHGKVLFKKHSEVI